MALNPRADENHPALGPASVPTNSLQPNPHNPRRLFDEAPLKVLEDSIRKVGILVPLTVYRAKGSQKFTILDGQRRWMCAQRVGLHEVPINEVREPSTVENITTMFQIHKLRKDWELMPTALKLGVLMGELKEKSDRRLTDPKHTLTRLLRESFRHVEIAASIPHQHSTLGASKGIEKEDVTELIFYAH